jgi:hypothetical protein
MKINEFVANVLQEIDSGLKEAGQKTGRDYSVEVGSGGGVGFDIAVTTLTSKGSQAEGQAKAGFIEVLGANVGAKLEDKKENSEVSRIQFKVTVPFQTRTEAEEDHRKAMEAMRSARNEKSGRLGL